MDDAFISKIINEYRSRLLLPSFKPVKQFILCPVGLIGSGKTSVLKELANELPFIRISNDQVRIIMLKYVEAPLDLELFTTIMTRVFDMYLDMGYSMAADSDCASILTQRKLEEKKNRYNLSLIWIYINPPESFILENFKHFDSTKQVTLKNEELAINNYMERKILHENLWMPFVYTFDTSRSDMDVQIKETVSLIKKEMDFK